MSTLERNEFYKKVIVNGNNKKIMYIDIFQTATIPQETEKATIYNNMYYVTTSFFL